MDSHLAQYKKSSEVPQAQDRVTASVQGVESPTFEAATLKIDLPGDGGAIRGGGEKFLINSVAGKLALRAVYQRKLLFQLPLGETEAGLNRLVPLTDFRC